MSGDRVRITLAESVADELLEWLEGLQVGLNEARFLGPLRDELQDPEEAE